MKIVLIGATGQLGSDLIRNNPGHDIFAPGRDVLDLDRLDQVATIMRREKPGSHHQLRGLPQCSSVRTAAGTGFSHQLRCGS